MLRFAYQRPDGGVTVVNAAPPEHLLRMSPPPFGRAPTSEEIESGIYTKDIWLWTDAEFHAHVLERTIPQDAINVIDLPPDWVEPDRDRRSEWVIKNGTVTI